jgi:hypothetical protein
MDVEAAVRVVMTEREGHPPNVINECAALVLAFQESPEGIMWSIANLPILNDFHLVLFALLTVRSWIQNRFELFSPEQQQDLHRLVFGDFAKSFGDEIQQAQINGVLSTVQLRFVENTYPMHWPTFWHELVQRPPGQVLGFLETFQRLEDEERQTWWLVATAAMREDGSESAVARFVCQCLLDGNRHAFPALTQLLTWVEPQLVLDHPVLPAIVNGLANPDLFSDAAGIFSGLLLSSLDPETKLSLLQEIHLNARISDVIANPDLLLAAAHLLGAAGETLMETAVSQDLYQTALILFSGPDDRVADSVLPFVTVFTERHPECATASLEAGMNRLALNFETLDEDTTEFDQFSSDILKLIDMTFGSESQQAAVTFLLEALPGCDTPASLAAAFHVLVHVSENRGPIIDANEIIPRFLGLLVPPPVNLSGYFTLTAFVKYFIREEEARRLGDASIAQQFFNVIFEHALFNYPEQQSEHLCGLLLRLIKIPDVTHTDDYVLTLVRTGRSVLIYSAANLIKKQADHELVFHAAVEILQQMLSESGNQHILIVLLKFVEIVGSCSPELLSSLLPNTSKYH